MGNPGSAVQAISPGGYVTKGVRLKSGKTLASNWFLKGFLRGSNRPRNSSGSLRAGNRVRTDDRLITNQLLNQLCYAGFSSRLSIRCVSGFRAQGLVSEDTKAEMCGGGSVRNAARKRVSQPDAFYLAQCNLVLCSVVKFGCSR